MRARGLARLTDEVRSNSRVWYAKGPDAALDAEDGADEIVWGRSMAADSKPASP